MTTKEVGLNIVLIGLTGCGKSTIARILARKLNREVLELDEMLVAKVGMTIPQIFTRHGEAYFRNRESEIAKEVSVLHGKIISTGGGVVLRPKNMVALRGNGMVVYLRCSVDVCAQRIGDDSNRPLVANKASMKEDLQERLNMRGSLYEGYADVVVDVDSQDAEAKAARILEEIGEGNL